MRIKKVIKNSILWAVVGKGNEVIIPDRGKLAISAR